MCFACPANYPAAYSSCPKCQLPLVFPDIGRVWSVEGLIGRGGMGAVFAAHHTEDRRKRAAVKVLVPIAGEMKADRVDRIGRFQREAEAMRRLVHQNIVQLYDFARERDGSLYLAMEYLQGPTLAKILKERGQLPESEAIELLLPVLSAIEAAHKVGVIHRDLKPDNIVLATVTDGKKEVERVKVVDFGVARLKDDSVTDTGQALGTPVYMAPEQAQGSDIDERVDIYGAGTVLYELLTGRAPFTPADTPHANLAVLAKIMTSDPPSVRERCPGLSPALEAVVERAMCRDREQRFATAADFASALVAAQKNPQEALWKRPEHIAPLALPAAVAAAAAAPPPSMRRSMPPVIRSNASLPPVMRSSASQPGGARSVPGAPSSPMIGGRSGPFSAVPPSQMSGGRSGPVSAIPASQMSVGRSGPLSRGPGASSSSGLPPVAAGAAAVGQSGAQHQAVRQPSRSSSGFSAPVGATPDSARSQPLRPPEPARGTSVGYKILIALVYLIAVSAILVSLLLDRTSCNPKPAKPNPVREIPAPAPTPAPT